MKATGIVRKVDVLGRIVLPKELRTTLDIKVLDPMEIYVEDKLIYLKKYQPQCVFCGEAKGVTAYEDKNICGQCISEI